MLPEAKKLKLAQMFEYEAQVEEVKRDVKEFKEETRNMLSTYTTMVSAISNSVSPTFNIGVPTPAVVEQAKVDLDHFRPNVGPIDATQNLVKFLTESENDPHFALVKVRIQLEKELRRVLGKSLDAVLYPNRDVRYLSLAQLFNNFLIEYPAYEQLSTSFSVVVKVANAAAHGQNLDGAQIYDALQMGIRILGELKLLPDKS